MGPRGWFVRLVGIILMSVLVVASAQPLMAQATETEAFVVATSADQVIGTFRAGNDHLRFDEDGTFRMGVGRDQLEHRPYDISDYWFEDAVLYVSNTVFAYARDPDRSGGVPGRYEVQLLEGGRLRIVLIEDPSRGRAGNFAKVYELVERVATSAEQVIGTWHAGSHYLRFEEGGVLLHAVGREALDTNPYVTDAYRFEDGVMRVDELVCWSTIPCREAVGRYEVRLLEGGNLRLVELEDRCRHRAGDMAWVYARVE